MEAAGHKCVGFVEIDKFAVNSYRAIHDTKGEFYANDIRHVKPTDLPKGIDCFCGGFPCQAFSINGKRQGFADTRGTLIHEILRLAADYNPQILFLENVVGLLTHDRGKTFTTILRAISELGYVCEWQCINSKAYLPQNRNRVYIIGHLGTKPRRSVFPIERTDGKTGIKVIGDIEESGLLDIKKRVHGIYGTSPTIDTDYRSPLIQVPLIYSMNWSDKSAQISAEAAYTLTTKVADNQYAIVDGIIRRLTPLECWRLQGFPDWAYEKAAEVNSLSQLYKQAGNSVTIPVIEEIAKRLAIIEKEGCNY